MSRNIQGRPIDPTSERSLKPWESLGISRAAFYWRKRYNDLPRNMLKKTVKQENLKQRAAKKPAMAYDF